MPARRKAMTDAHKQALAQGREDARAVRKYLELMVANKPRRGRKRTKETVQKQLDDIGRRLRDGARNPLEELQLRQRQLDLAEELKVMESSPKDALAPAEREFVKVARRYSESKGISAEAWRAMGVPRETLKKAGVG